MKKKIYRISQLVLSAAIGLTGFGACKTAKTAEKPAADAISGATGQYQPAADSLSKTAGKGDSLKARPLPNPHERVVVLYGVRPPVQVPVKPDNEIKKKK